MKKYIPLLILSTTIVCLPFVSLAQTKANPPDTTSQNPGTSIDIGITNPFGGAGDCSGSSNCLVDYLKTLTEKLVLPIGAVIAVCMFIWTGFLFVSAQGDKGKVAKARASLVTTSIGTAILLGAWVIATVIETTINQLR